MTPEEHFKAARAAHAAGDFPVAVQGYCRILVQEPNEPEVLRLVAQAHCGLHEFDLAESALRHAVALEPSCALTWTMLGSVLGQLARWDEVGEAYDTAFRLQPHLPALRWNRALWKLHRGDYAAWAEYAWGLVTGDRKLRTLQPSFRGNDSGEGRTLLIWAEQGIGDTLMMLRFLPRVRECFGFERIVLEVQPELVPLLADFPAADLVIAQSQDRSIPVQFDAHVSLMALPSILSIATADDVRCEPYLASPGRGIDPKRLRVGLVWSGNPSHANDWQRSVDPELLRPLLETPGCAFTSFQVGVPCPEWLGDTGGKFRSWADTHRALGDLDLLITVDTGIAHLAGACGVPTWVLLPAVGDWRWGLFSPDTPWYGSVWLYRQPQPGDWATPIEAVRQSLEIRARQHCGAAEAERC